MGLLDSLIGSLGSPAGAGGGATEGRGGGNLAAALIPIIVAMLAQGGRGGGAAPAAEGGGGLGGLGGLLGGLMGGNAGGGSAGGLGAALGGGGGGGAGLGGLAGLVEAFAKNGLGEVAGSWVGSGRNLPVSPEQLEGVFGADRIGAIAGQLGVDRGEVLGQMSELLPQVVDRMTPQGRIPEGDIGSMLGSDDLSALLGALGGTGRR